MTNTEKIIEELKALPEIDLEVVLGEIETHIHRNKMDHLIDTLSGRSESIDELEKQVDDNPKLTKYKIFYEIH